MLHHIVKFFLNVIWDSVCFISLTIIIINIIFVFPRSFFHRFSFRLRVYLLRGEPHTNLEVEAHFAFYEWFMLCKWNGLYAGPIQEETKYEPVCF